MIQRTIKKYVIDSLDLYPVIVLTGARQIGKSTLAISLQEKFNFHYVSLDDIDNRRMVIGDSKLFI